MNKELTPLEIIENKIKDSMECVNECRTNGLEYGRLDNEIAELVSIGKELKKLEQAEFELEVFKLAYEWKCNGVEGTYEEVLEQARKTVEGWKEINKKGYGTIIAE